MKSADKPIPYRPHAWPFMLYGHAGPEQDFPRWLIWRYKAFRFLHLWWVVLRWRDWRRKKASGARAPRP